MKKTISIIMVLALVAVVFCSSAMGETKVTWIRLVEKGASLRDCPRGTKIGSIHGKTYLSVYDAQDGWYLVSYNGQDGWVSAQQVMETIYDPEYDPMPGRTSSRRDVPYIGTMVYGLNTSHSSVRWVQTQLKATGIWYQGDEWRVTGHVGKHTMSEIRSFMQSMGYPHHTGVVDQSVIDALCDYLGY